jgi:hypothetical protein
MQPLGEIRENEYDEAPETSRISILFVIAKYVNLTEPPPVSCKYSAASNCSFDRRDFGQII